MPKGVSKADKYDAIDAAKDLPSPDREIRLMLMLDDPNSDVRWYAVDALWEVDTRLARVGVRAALSDPDPDWRVRETAAEALGEIGNRSDVPRLAPLLGDPEWVVRASAAGSIGTLGGRRALKLLQQALTDPDAGVRRYAASGIGILGDPAGIPILEEVLRIEESDHGRSGMLIGFYELGQQEVLPALLELIESPDYQVRCQVLDALEDWIRPDDTPPAIAALDRRRSREDIAHIAKRIEETLAELRRRHPLPDTE